MSSIAYCALVSHSTSAKLKHKQSENSVPELVFDVQNITYRYNSDLTALNGVSLSITRGTRVAIMGANGSGKSTLLRILDGLYFPDQGAVSVFGQPLTEEQLLDETFAFDFRRRVALVFQNPDVQLF